MKRIILTVFALVVPLIFYGQMSLLSDQYLNSNLTFNPAFAGSQDALSISVLYRDQWVGFRDAPKNYEVSLHAPVRNDRIGIGFLIGNSSFSIYRETSLMADYAYRLEVSGGILALGLGFGAKVKYVAWNELRAADPNDLLLNNYPESAILPDFSLGAYYQAKRLFLGISFPWLIGYDINQNTQKYSMTLGIGESNYYFEGGYYFNLARQIKLLPSFLFKYRPGHAPQVDITTQLFFGERLGLGFGYRNNNTLIGLLQLHLNKQAMIGYSYSFDTGKVGRYNSGSHEFVLNYLFSYSYRVTSPRQF